MKVLDFYFQIGTDHWAQENRPDWRSTSTRDDFTHLRNSLSAQGYQYDGAVVFPPPSAPSADFDASNDLVCEAALADELAARTFSPMFAIKPHDAKSIGWLRKILESDKSCAGVKCWPYMGRFSLMEILSDHDLVTLIRQHRLLVHLHVGTGREIQARPAFKDVDALPAAAVRVASALPDVTFVVSHLLRLSKPSLLAASAMENVYLDTSGLSALGVWKEGGRDGLPADDADDLSSKTPAALLNYLIDELGFEKRMVFGSNWPFCTWWKSDLLHEISIIVDSPLSISAKQNILANNAMRLLARSGKQKLLNDPV